jgi:seryl-tRNA synthetase
LRGSRLSFFHSTIVLSPEEVIQRLRGDGSLWDVAPGVTGLKGPVVTLLAELEGALSELARAETSDEWRPPAGVSFETLERAQYFASFPQWLTAASHLSGDQTILEGIARATSPGAVARSSLAPADVVLPPAVCYNTYAALADSVIASPVVMTAQATCWRHEGDRISPLERGWAFTMREIVCLGAEREVKNFLDRSVARVTELERVLGLNADLEAASDPFFAPTARGRAALQRIKGLKHELVFRFADGKPLAIASFNDHELFFGEAFGIRLPDGKPAWSGCVAFGLERWLLAVLSTYGVDQRYWPISLAATSESTRLEKTP